jgi:SPP1 gp7 family putative phage head morphogenesis protein
MTESEVTRDVYVEHQVGLQFYINFLHRKMIKIVQKLEKQLKGDLTLFDEVSNGVRTKADLMAEVKDSLDTFEKDIEDEALAELRKFTEVEKNFYLEEFRDGFKDTKLKTNTEPKEKTFNFINRQNINFEDGRFYTLIAFIRNFAKDNRVRVEQQIKSSLGYQKDEREVRDSVVGVGGQTHITGYRLFAMLSTLVAFISRATRDRVFKLNNDKIKGYQWVSVMDSRTTEFCRWADGKTWYYDNDSGTLGSPYTPPVHFSCRSMTTPIYKSWEELGLDESYAERFPTQIPDRTTYYQWLERQPKNVQLDVLGATRYDLWKNKGITPDRFYNRQGKYLTLQELQKRSIDIPKQYRRFIKE